MDILRHIKLKRERDKDKNNKLISFRIDDEKLLEKYETIFTEVEGLKNIELNVLSAYDDRYVKTEIRTYGNKVYTYFRELNVPEDDIEYESFTVTFIDALNVHGSKYYLLVYLDNCAYKIVNKEMGDYLDENVFEYWIL